MNSKTIIFQSPMKVALEGREVGNPGENQMLVKKRYSLISTGTELACLSGGESWFEMPGIPGYCCVSEVVEAGGSAPYAAGTVLYHYGNHSEYQMIDGNDFIVPVQDAIDLKLVPMLRMATIAFTAVRVADIELGDWVAVSGLGLVGNMAAQLAALSGAFVIGADPSQMRRAKAGECGIANTVGQGMAPFVNALTGGNGVHTAIEATGIPQVALDLLDIVGYHGEIILLGTPRGSTETNLADVLRYCHIDGMGSVTFKGAHEWRYPVTKEKFVKHSIQRNTEICMNLVRQNRLHIRELISHIVKPEEAPEAYLGVHANRDAYLGVIIDWN